MRSLRILGTRGIPAAHGGFETFAERLALYLVEKGWSVTVYCQEDGHGVVAEDMWRGVHRVRIPIATRGAAGTVLFDWKATLHAARHRDLCLTLGYNTAIFCALLRLRGIKNVINMDGLEWKRAKWGPIAKAWFYVNERAGCILGDRLIADNPEIQRHLETRVKVDKITMVPYGADRVTSADVGLVTALGLEPHSFLAVIARPEPENSILEIVRAFSRCKRGVHLAVLGKYDEANPYCRAVKSSASDEVKFLGPIYDKHVVEALRYHSIGYIHGHQVGGTNPSLVEALGAGCPVIAHDNKFNRWVAGPDALYFSEEDTCDAQLTRLLTQPEVAQRMRNSSRDRHLNAFQWFDILESYERLLSGMGWPAGRPQSRGYC